MSNNYTTQDRGDNTNYKQYLEAMDAIAIEKVASASVFFEPNKDNIIVDVGMASGTSTAILAHLFPQMQVIGVDINSKMVEIARETYDYPNLSFRIDDGERLQTFENNLVNGFFNCSAIHHITSYNGYDSNRAINTLRKQVELLKENGVLVVRDFVKPSEKEVIIELSTQNRNSEPSNADLFIQFSQTARSLASMIERGFPIEELKQTKKGWRRFKAYYTDVVEFIRRKDYYANWNIELQEEYGYFTQEEFENLFHELGLRIIQSSPIYNQWIINNRYKGQFYLYDLDGQIIGYPPTNYLIAGDKVPNGKRLELIRHLSSYGDSFLKYSSYLNTVTKKIFDVVERPNTVIDIIPYYKTDNGFTIWAKHGYPRPLTNVNTDSPILDNKKYSGYITEGLTIGETDNLYATLEKRFGIDRSYYKNIIQSLNYYTSPGGINEKVSSMFVELTKAIDENKALTNGFSGFKESGYIHQYDARQLLNTAQTGALVEARLELNIYHLFFTHNLSLPNWLGEKIEIKECQLAKTSKLSELFSIQTSYYEKCDSEAAFLSKRRAYFSEIGINDSNAILEYVYPSLMSSNTLTTIPVFKSDQQIYIGLEIRYLPVPQIHTGNSTIITIPAKRLPKEVKNIHDLEQYIYKLKIGESRIERYSKLGEKYFPSIGITTEQVYPYVVCLDQVDHSLKWVNIDDLYQYAEKIEDAHLLISLYRLMHMIEPTLDMNKIN